MTDKELIQLSIEALKPFKQHEKTAQFAETYGMGKVAVSTNMALRAATLHDLLVEHVSLGDEATGLPMAQEGGGI
jgi:hypothetical protein